MGYTKSEILEHLLFWQWEYERRSPSRPEPRKFVQSNSNTLTSIPSDSGDGFGYNPIERGHAYKTSDDIINALINKSFQPLYPPYYNKTSTDTGITRLIDQKTEFGLREFIRLLENSFSEDTKLFSIDLNKPLAELTAELETIHSYYQKHGMARPWGNDNARLMHKYSALAKDGKIIGTLEARAIGLWIYDQEQKGRDNKSALARELMQREGFAELGKGNIVQYASPWSKKTEKCIKMKTILPIR